MATFGTGYVRKPMHWPGPNRRPNGRDLILEWFKNDNFCNGSASLDCLLFLTLRFDGLSQFLLIAFASFVSVVQYRWILR
jgi:hypothetical protein